MKPSEITIGEQYRNSKYPNTVYLGVIGHDGEPALQIARSENEDMMGRIVKWNEKESTIEFWSFFSHAIPVDLTQPVSHHKDSIGENDQEPPQTENKHRGRPKVERASLLLPVGEFSVKELAEQNKVDYPIAFIFVKEQMAAGAIEKTRSERRAAKGKETQLFKVITS